MATDSKQYRDNLVFTPIEYHILAHEMLCATLECRVCSSGRL